MGLLDDVLACSAEEFGIPGEVGSGLLAVNGPYPKAMFGLPRGTADATRMTSTLSALAHKFPELDYRSPVLKSLAGTPSLLRATGRMVPYLGAGLLGYDAYSIAQCVGSKQP